MTPKEKAEDLLYQMRYDHMSGTLTKRKAKRCALIAVDEIIASNPNLKWFAKLDDSIKYWEEVKKEIENL
jgi:glutaredoxin-related protein